ncbi:thioesterase II family protein [Planomonospora parontospora]|uniref:thioesterase II family protein n=1 Tax=Planomonospora parontospora TaxID=58119 RepID=UPI001671289C|nr:alpha/beta fold hydrolase [Planomonospora parontospora]GGL11890.1 thioesterase [Planomonospora parontospora subsp. antibiotica]GII14105.1 thioesterase [Planomonospora parontospora subsp. antibiotica]
MTWLRCPRPRPAATTRLICFAHAGGSATAYRDWPALLPDTVELYGVQLPGRADRYGEPLPESMDALAAAVAGELAPLLDRRFALFGHSLGALVAYEVTRILEGRGTGPVRLFASGCAAPHERRDRGYAEYDDDRLVAVLNRLGGTETEVLAHGELRKLVLPYVRGDFRLAERYLHRPGLPLRTPISVLVGDADPVVTPAQAKAWETHTASDFSMAVFPGGHFYLQPLREQVVAEVAGRI